MMEDQLIENHLMTEDQLMIKNHLMTEDQLMIED